MASSYAAEMKPESRYGPAVAGLDPNTRFFITTDPTVAWANCDKKLRDRAYLTVKSWKEDVDTPSFSNCPDL